MLATSPYTDIVYLAEQETLTDVEQTPDPEDVAVEAILKEEKQLVDVRETVKTISSVTGTTMICMNALTAMRFAAGTSISGLFFFAKFFQVIDFMTNLIGKVNVRAGTRIDTLVVGLKALQLPKIGFLERFSPVDDGGKDQVDSLGKKLKIFFFLKLTLFRASKRCFRQNI